MNCQSEVYESVYVWGGHAAGTPYTAICHGAREGSRMRECMCWKRCRVL